MTTAATRAMVTQIGAIGVIGAAALGCATASREVGHGDEATMQRPAASLSLDRAVTSGSARTGDVLTAAELSLARGLVTAYDAVVRLRPGFLNPRDARMATVAGRGLLPAVFVDGAYSGGVDVLRVFPASEVAEMRYVRPIEAMHRYGPDYRAGVILVRLRR